MPVFGIYEIDPRIGKSKESRYSLEVWHEYSNHLIPGHLIPGHGSI